MLIDATELRTLFDIATQIADDRLTFCIRNGSRTLISWVGGDAYADAGAEESEDEERAAALKDAESYLAMYQALLNTSARIRRSGIVKQEQDAAGPMNGTVVNQYYSPGELKALRDEYFKQAETIAAPYQQETSGTGIGAATITMPGGWANS